VHGRADRAPPRLQRSEGHVAVAVGRDGALVRAYQSGSGKLRIPTAGEVLVLNTSGGLAGGDRFRTEFRADGSLTVATVASERVYRSEGEAAAVRQHLAVTGRLRHLPQPTIVFDGAHLDRLTTVELAAGACLTLAEGLVLGREAMGESVRTLSLRDRTEVRRDGRLAFVDALRLTSASLARLGGPAGLGGARGIGLVVHAGPDLDAALERVRGEAGAAASLVGGVLVARCLAPGHTALQDALARIVTALDGEAPPRSWRL
jgi:urease accessory protein